MFWKQNLLTLNTFTNDFVIERHALQLGQYLIIFKIKLHFITALNLFTIFLEGKLNSTATEYLILGTHITKAVTYGVRSCINQPPPGRGSFCQNATLFPALTLLAQSHIKLSSFTETSLRNKHFNFLFLKTLKK